MTFLDYPGDDEPRITGHPPDPDGPDGEYRGCECELDWNCGCGRYSGLPPIDVLMDRWSQDHP